MATTTERYATYRGHTYRLVFVGDTKFGRRAKLAFRDGSKEFWVTAGDITECRSGGVAETGAGRPVAACCRCGERLVLDELSAKSRRRVAEGRPTCCPDCLSGIPD